MTSRRRSVESMSEFDLECPMVKRFCQPMSEDDFEEQGLTYTQKALQELFKVMEQQPELCERVIRKRKQVEMERANVGTSLKAKFFSVMEGHLNRCNTVGAEELRDRVSELRTEMEKVQVYAEEAKGATRRVSKRLLEKQKSLAHIVGQEGPHPSCAPPPPPPPPPVRVTSLKHDTIKRDFNFQQMAATPELLASYGLSRLNNPLRATSSTECNNLRSQPLSMDIKAELLSYNPAKQLKTTGIIRSPGGTPTARPSIRHGESSPASAFNTALITKFRNTQASPAPDCQQSSENEEDGFVTPPASP